MFLGNKFPSAGKSVNPVNDWNSMENVVPDASASFNSPAFYKWAHDYDAVGEVRTAGRLSHATTLTYYSGPSTSTEISKREIHVVRDSRSCIEQA